MSLMRKKPNSPDEVKFWAVGEWDVVALAGRRKDNLRKSFQPV